MESQCQRRHRGGDRGRRKYRTQSRDSRAAIDASTGALTSFNAGDITYSVHALALAGTTLYVGGGTSSVTRPDPQLPVTWTL